MAEITHSVDIAAFLLNNLSKKWQSDYLKKFGSLKTNVERVNFIYSDLLELCPDYPPFVKDEKSDDEAVEIREIGNACFGLGQYRAAFDHYTVSILKAKTNAVLSLAYANRSAALYKLNRYDECLMDIKRALQHGYPDELKPKLIARQNQAKTQKAASEKVYEPVPKIPPSKKNPLIECAANNVKIVMTQQYGRAVIATRDIQIGDIIAIEQPYAAIVYNEMYDSYCHECMDLCYNLIPCNTCTKALYCSVKCKDQAFNYHQYECPIQLSLDSLDLDLSKKLALKILFLYKNELEKSDSYEFEENEVYRSDRFKEVYNMEGHVKERDDLNLFGISVLAAGMYHLIKNYTTFLQDGMNEDRLKDILLSLILICGINNVNIDQISPELMSYNVIQPLAIGVYSFFTLLNHSCWANIICQFHGNKMVMRAINTIKEGEQCFVSYGLNYLFDHKEFRQSFLSNHHFFKCTCRACEEDWPVKDVLDVQRLWQGQWPFDVLLTMMKRSGGYVSVDVAKEELPLLLSKAKIFEKNLPPGRDYEIKYLLEFCYNIFGNKRRI